MRRNLCLLTGFILFTPLYAALASPIGSVNQLVVFGDSLSDNGNAAFVAGPLWPANYAPNALTDGPHTTPATTGPFGLWIDQFAAKAGLPDPQPYLTNPISGTNYAVATAQTGSANVQDIGNQLTAFNVTHLGSAPSNALYVIWGGANDIFDSSNPNQAATQAASNLNSYIQTLAGEGGKYFLWLDLPPLGDTPYGTTQHLVAPLNTAASLFDSDFETDVAALQNQGIQVTGVNIDQLFQQLASSPSSYGFNNITASAQGLNVDPNNYLFWDDVHPTTAGDAAIADFAYNDLGGAASAPEPLNAGLCFLGLFGVAAVYRLRSKAVDRR